MDGLAEDGFCWFRPPKSVQEEDSLLVQSKPESTRYKDDWVVRFSVLGKQRASQNSMYLTREACSKNTGMICAVCKVSKRS